MNSSPFRVWQCGLAALWVSLVGIKAAESSPSDSTYPLAITEFLAVNDSGIADEDGDHSDWLEIFNYGDQPVNLAGIYLTDDADQPTRWQFPEIELAGKDYRLVFLSGKDRRQANAPLHANFALNRKGGYLALIHPNGKNVLHGYLPAYPRQYQNRSYGLLDVPGPSPAQRVTHGYFAPPTPGSPNSSPVKGRVEVVKLNQDQGWQHESFTLKLKTKTDGATIRYTLDGTEPTASHGLVYSEPLEIQSTTTIRIGAFKAHLQASPIKTRSFLFVDDILRQSPDGLPPESFPYHWGRNKVNYGMDPRVVNDPRYRDEIVAGFYSLPVFSIVMNLDDLFDEKHGIYSNAENDGREWERPCSMEYVTANGEKGFQIDCGIRIRGGFSRRPDNPKHSFRFFFRDLYGPGSLDYPLFGKQGAQSFDHLDLRTFQNYGWHLGSREAIFLRDQFSRDLQLATGQPAARGEYCHLFINGHYWGLYNTCERIKASYGANYFGGKKSHYDAIKKGRSLDPDTGDSIGVMANDGNLKAWKKLWTLADAGLNKNDAYFRLLGKTPSGEPDPTGERLLDVDNLIDFMLVTFYSGNYDGPISAWGSNMGPNNWYGIRNRKRQDGFRFFVWDAEHTYKDVREDRTGPFPAGGSFSSSNPQWLFQQCLENEEFRVRVGDRVQKHFYGRGALTAESVRKRFLERVSELESAAICESARWGDARSTSRDGRSSSRSRPLNRDDHWVPVITRLLEEHFPRRSTIVLAQLFSQGVISDVPAPRFEKRNQGQVSLSTNKGVIYYTLDGSDPRQVGGQVRSGALEAGEQTITLSEKQTLQARTRFRDDWSALVEVRP